MLKFIKHIKDEAVNEAIDATGVVSSLDENSESSATKSSNANDSSASDRSIKTRACLSPTRVQAVPKITLKEKKVSTENPENISSEETKGGNKVDVKSKQAGNKMIYKTGSADNSSDDNKTSDDNKAADSKIIQLSDDEKKPTAQKV